MRLVFMGTPAFAVPALEALRAAGHEIAEVFTQPARPAGRGQREQRSAVHDRAHAAGIFVRTPHSLRDDSTRDRLRALAPEAIVVVAYGQILPRAVLDIPPRGCLNIHASLLPRWRGAAPIQRAILEGDAQTGVTIMQMEPGLDTGPMLLRDTVPIKEDTTAGDLHDRLAEMGGELIVQALAGVEAGTLEPVPQPEAGVTYAAKVTKDDGHLTWQDATYCGRQVRALNPWPGTWVWQGGERLRVLAAEGVPGASGRPGQVLDDRLTVACAAGGGLRILRLQRSGKAAQDAEAFLRGYALPPGTVLGAAD